MHILRRSATPVHILLIVNYCPTGYWLLLLLTFPLETSSTSSCSYFLLVGHKWGFIMRL